MRARLALAPAVVLALMPALAQADCAAQTDVLAELRASQPSYMAAADRIAAGLPNASGVLWRMERRGVPASWLFGTIHMSDPRVTRLTPTVERLITQANVVALELPPDSAGDVAEAVRRSADRIRRGGRDLQLLVGTEAWPAVDNALRDAGLDPFRSRFTPPALVAVSITTAPCEQRMRAGGGRILDHVVRDVALQAGVRVIGLETAEEQIAALTASSVDDQVRMLVTAARNRPAADLRADLAIRLWLERRPSYLKALAQAAPDANAAGDRAFNVAVFDRRNAVMRDRALPLLQNGNVFIAVGAGHLSGRQGLVELFRRAGYTVTRVD